MKRIFPVLLAALALFCWGCGSSDNFVFTNSGPQPGVPTQLAFVQNPAQTTNTDFSTPPIVEVQDAFGNRVPGATNTITVSLVNPGTAVLNGQTTRDAIDGRATFTGLSVNEPGTFTLTCTAQGLTSANSATFTVTPSLALFALVQESGNSGNNPTQLVQLDPSTAGYVGTFGFLQTTADYDQFQDIECLPNGPIYLLGFDKDADSSRLATLNLATPPSFSDLGLITGVDFIYSLAYDANGQILYGIAEPLGGGLPILCTIDTTTLVATLAPNDLGGAIEDSAGRSLAFDDSTNTLYYVDDDSLYTVDTTTGTATLVGAGDTLNLDPVKGLDFNPTTNQLLAADRDDAEAAFINTSNGTDTIIGKTPGHIAGLSFCENSGVAPAGPARQTGYTVSGITQAFVDISSTGTALNLLDDGNSTEPIGFTFNFDGTAYTNIVVDANGYASFNNTNGNTDPELLPTENLFDNTLLVWWDDLDSEEPPINPGNIYVETLGSAPNRTFVIQYQTNHNENFTQTIDVEIILYEGTDVIEYHYADTTFGDPDYDDGACAVVGIQTDSTHADIWSIFQPVITSTTAIRFTPPAP
jgi:hypothetical protein